MDAVIIAIRDAADEDAIRRAVALVGLSVVNLASFDSEIEPGLSAAKAALAWDRLLQVSDSASSRDSGNLVNTSFEYLLSDDLSLIEKLAYGIAESSTVGPITLVFCYEWSRESEITYYKGSPAELSVYLRLNGGPYRMTRSSPKYTSPDIDLDTPLIWLISKFNASSISKARDLHADRD
ncbi:MAG: hypothetical protein NT171_16525 [Planctomycetota bacterium]|nr:hypothetical protein [Planctomycetota bacterium]